MGCVCTRKNIKIRSSASAVGDKAKQDNDVHKNASSVNTKHTVYFNKITQGCALRIFDYLNFKDLYECGKCCSMFKLLSSNPDLLKKFFMNLKMNSTFQQDKHALLSSNNNKLNLNIKLCQTFCDKNKAIEYIGSFYGDNLQNSLVYGSSTSVSNEGTPRFTHMLY